MKKLLSALLLAFIFLAGCYPVTGKLPAINSFDARPASISAGESSTLSWTVTGATSVSIDQGIGNVALSSTRGVAPAATTVYTLTASSSAGSITATTQVIVTGATPPPATLPVINSFTASPSSISLGSPSTLSWNVSNATSVTIDNGVGAVGSSGSAVVLPAVTTTFILTASNAAGSTTATALILVSGVPPGPTGLPVINYFTASPPVIPGASGSTLLRWNVSDATSVSIDNGIGPIPSSGTMLLTLTATTNYTLTATNAYGWRTQTLPVLVTGGGGPTVAYDFIEQAPTAYWWTKVDASMVELPFPGATNDSRGFATYQYNIKLSDGNTYAKVLETHPQWINNGWISGKYSGVYVPPGARLRIKIGLINGATAGNADFHLGKLGAVATITRVVTYADGVQVVEADLSAYAGQTIDFVLGVNAGSSSAQDWAAWAEAQIIY